MPTQSVNVKNLGVKIVSNASLRLIVPLCLSLITSIAYADATGIMITDLTIRGTTAQAGATAAYGTFHNHSPQDDRLIRASVTYGKKTEIHQMTLDGDVMKMREIIGGIEIPAGEMIRLKQGGDHIMIMGLSEPITLDNSYEITFEFEKAGIITKKAIPVSLSGKPRQDQQDHDDHNDHAGHNGHKH